MTQFPLSTSNEPTIYAALELSKNSWLLALQSPGRDNPSLHPIKGGTSGPAGRMAARQTWSRGIGRVPLLARMRPSPSQPTIPRQPSNSGKS